MSLTKNPVSAYRQTTVKTAGQGKLIVMLYDEAVRQIDTAIELLVNKTRRLDLVHNALSKCQDVVTELMAGLDFERGEEIASNLLSLYIFVNDKLREANMKKSIPPAQDARGVMAELRSAWVQLANQTHASSSESGKPAGLNIAG